MHTTYSEMRTMGGRTNRGVGFDKSSHLYYARTCCMGTYSNYISTYTKHKIHSTSP